MRKIYSAALVVALSVTPIFVPAFAGEADEANTLTHGMVQMTLKVGETNQAEILEKFGAPNITTIDGSGQEMWVYDRHATVSYDKQSGFSIGLAVGGGGGGVGAGGGLGFGSKKSKSSTSSRTMTLIIKFDANKVVSDFKSRSSSF
jgi:outer membrane protein assembly factor BamE (lipoprotein component of BamABCDE complex)